MVPCYALLYLVFFYYKTFKERGEKMIDIKLIRENKDLVKENIKKKFQEHKLEIVDEVEKLDVEFRECKQKVDNLRNLKNTKSSEIGNLMRSGEKAAAETIKKEVASYGEEIAKLSQREEELTEEIKKRMMMIPNIVDESVPVGKDDNENVEIEKYGEPFVPDYEIPYHADIIEALN